MTLVFRLFDAIGVPFSFWAISLSLLFISGMGFVITLESGSVLSLTTTSLVPGEDGQRSAWTVPLIALALIVIIYKIFLATNEIVLRPLFPWDAWDSWAPLTIQYFDSGGLTADLKTKASIHGKTVS